MDGSDDHTEPLTKQEIAKALGLNPKHAKSVNRWGPDTHDNRSAVHYKFDELGVGDKVIPFRVVNVTTREVFTKLAGDFYQNKGELRMHPVDPAKVDALYAEVMAIQHVKNLEVEPAIFAAIPEMDPGEKTLVELTVGGVPVKADLIDGKLVNVRERPAIPAYTTDANGTLIVHAYHLADHHRAAVVAAAASVKNAHRVAILHTKDGKPVPAKG